ncbi:MAG: hypothetical protein N2323_05980 [candidate division WOR-3 bacterium]|nr:hypothetical protein [candidate division WOR-3 bacterium]MCX7837482.1 hypothetical protein [candidate division WOR-3 bacterium]MDW8114756.1 hypothetical protein [candidate division WOR-3 bacterium]
MRSKIFLITLLLIFLACSEAPKREFQGNRLVLCEFFTFARCVYCPYAEAALESLRKEFKDSIIIIAYHRRLLGDTLSPEDVEARRSFYYEEGGEPVVFFNGSGPIRTEDPSLNYSTYKNEIQKERSKKLKVLVNLDNNSDTIKIVLFACDTLLSRDLRLLGLITFDSIFFKQAGARESVYHNVYRGFLVNQKIELNYGDSLIIPIYFSNQQNKTKFIVFLQDFNNKEILNSNFYHWR